MSKPVSNNVDLTLLLSSLQTLTNKVNALQTAAAQASKPTGTPGKINSLDEELNERMFTVDNTSEYERLRNVMITKNDKLSMEFQANTFSVPWGSEDKAKAPVFALKLKTYLDKFRQDPSGAPTATVRPQLLNSKLPIRRYFSDVCANYITDEDGSPNNLWPILQAMPKGGMLHIHSGAICDLPWIINTGVSGFWRKDLNDLRDPSGLLQVIGVNKDMYDDAYYYNRDRNAANNFFRFFTLPAGTTEATAQLVQGWGQYFTSDVSGAAKDGFPAWSNQYYNLAHSSNKGPEFKAKLSKLLYMVGTDVDPRNSLARQDIPYVWNAFDTIITSRYSSLRKAGLHFTDELFRQGLLTLYNDGVRHLDVRFGFGQIKSDPSSIIQEHNVLREMNSTMQKIDQLERVKPIAGGVGVKQGQTGDMTINYILAPPRLTDASYVSMSRHLEGCFQLISGKYRAPGSSVEIDVSAAISNAPVSTSNPTKMYNYWKRNLGNWIVGYDLIAEEDKTQKQNAFRDAWVKTNELSLRYRVGDASFNYYMHAGESEWLSNDNVVDAVLLGAKRIGHGFNIALRPGILEEAKSKNICLEVCPISNQMLHYTPDLRGHFVNALFRQGLPICLSSDDPVMYGYNGMTADYWAAVVAWDLTLQQLKTIVWNGIRYSSLRYSKKVTMLVELEVKWNDWIRSTSGFWAN